MAGTPSAISPGCPASGGLDRLKPVTPTTRTSAFQGDGLLGRCCCRRSGNFGLMGFGALRANGNLADDLGPASPFVERLRATGAATNGPARPRELASHAAARLVDLGTRLHDDLGFPRSSGDNGIAAVTTKHESVLGSKSISAGWQPINAQQRRRPQFSVKSFNGTKLDQTRQELTIKPTADSRLRERA